MDTQVTSSTESADNTAQSSGAVGVELPSAAGDAADIVPATSEPSTPSSRKHGLLSPLRVANFRLLFTGQLVSRMGDSFYYVALPWLVLRATSAASAPVALSFVLGSYSVALGLFTLAGGVFADRYGPRPLMLVTDTWRLLVITALAVLTLAATPPLWVVAALSAGLGIGGGLFYPASVAMVPHLVESDDLQAANSFDQLGMQVSNLLGPSAAGFILAATRIAFGFVVDAVSFAVSVLSLFAIHMPGRPAPATATAATGDDATAGEGATTKKKAKNADGGLRELLRFLRATPFIILIVTVSLVLNFAVNGLVDVALPLLLKQQVGLSAGPRAFGIIIGGFGLGSVIGAVGAGMASGLKHKTLVAVIALLPPALLIGLVPAVHNPYAIAGLFCGAGVFLGIDNVLIITVAQRLVPLELMGRIMSVMMLGSFIGTPLSLFAYGFLATIVPNIGLLFIAGASLFALGALAALSNKMTWQN